MNQRQHRRARLALIEQGRNRPYCHPGKRFSLSRPGRRHEIAEYRMTGYSRLERNRLRAPFNGGGPRRPMDLNATTYAIYMAPQWTLEDFIEAAESARMLERHSPAPPLELTQAEFERLKEVCEPYLRTDPVSTGLPAQFMGLPIVIKP